MTPPLRMLLVEDSPDDAELLRARLEANGRVVELHRVDTPEAMASALEAGPWDVIVADYSLPRFDGRRALQMAQERGIDAPFIAVSGTIGEERAVELMRLGAKDFVLKGRLERLLPAVERELAAAESRKQKRTAEEQREALVTELEIALRDAARLNASLAEASRAKDEFLAIVSHELRTPLNAILGWAVTLRRKSESPGLDLDRGLEVIERNARVQAHLIDDVLDVSRIVSGKLRLHVAPIDVATPVREAVDTVRPAAESKGVTLRVDIAEDGGTIDADADRIRQIVWNLASNAVKFTPAGGVVDVALRRARDGVVVTVHDTGEGIRPDHLGLIFEPFRQADASTTRRHGGLGLGLSIARQLANAHGGSIRAESPGDGCGATFTLELPSSRHPDGAPSEPATDLAEERRLDGVSVLLVDDDRDAREIARTVLVRRGATVRTAGHLEEALAAVLERRPDVVVSDIGMPAGDGYALAERLRALDGPRIPAAAVTAYAAPRDVARALAAGFEVHVKKPVDPDDLVATIARLAGRG